MPEDKDREGLSKYRLEKAEKFLKKIAEFIEHHYT